MRRIMAQGYQVPRLISIVGRAHVPDVEEFSSDQIDENAEIVVYTGSALSSSPAVRTQQVIELWNAKMLGDPANPEVQRRALTMLDHDGVGELQEETRRDEEQSRLENLYAQQGRPVDPAHALGEPRDPLVRSHRPVQDPDFKLWPMEQQRKLVGHALLHARWINPQMATTLATELGFEELMPYLQPPASHRVRRVRPRRRSAGSTTATRSRPAGSTARPGAARPTARPTDDSARPAGTPHATPWPDARGSAAWSDAGARQHVATHAHAAARPMAPPFAPAAMAAAEPQKAVHKIVARDPRSADEPDHRCREHRGAHRQC